MVSMTLGNVVTLPKLTKISLIKEKKEISTSGIEQ